MRLSAWLGAIATALTICVPAKAGEPVRIGLVLSSGPVSQEIANGLAMALDEHGPVVAGRPIHLIREDNSGKPETALDRARKLVERDRSDVLVGPVSSAEALALRDYADEARVPLVVPEAAANAITGVKCSRYVVRVSYASDQIATTLAGYLAAGRGRPKRIYMIAADDPAGRDMLGAFRNAYEAAGGEIVGETYVPRGAADFAPYLLKLRLTGAEMAFAHFGGSAAEKFVSAYHELRLQSSVKLAGSGWLVSPFHRGNLRLDLIAGAVGAVNYVPDGDAPAGGEFVRRFAARYGTLPSEHAAHGYDAGRLILAALHAVRGRTADRQALAQALSATPFEGARGPLRIDPATNNVVEDILVVKNSFGQAADATAGNGAMTGTVLARVPAVKQSNEGCRL